jgi:hypothetical protein
MSDASHKIAASHLQRTAVVYIRHNSVLKNMAEHLLMM